MVLARRHESASCCLCTGRCIAAGKHARSWLPQTWLDFVTAARLRIIKFLVASLKMHCRRPWSAARFSGGSAVSFGDGLNSSVTVENLRAVDGADFCIQRRNMPVVRYRFIRLRRVGHPLVRIAGLVLKHIVDQMSVPSQNCWPVERSTLVKKTILQREIFPQHLKSSDLHAYASKFEVAFFQGER